jgi:hypothetical protein
MNRETCKHQLTIRALAAVIPSGDRFAFALFNWGFKVTMLSHVRKDSSLGHFALKSSQSGFNSLILTEDYLGHSLSSIAG